VNRGVWLESAYVRSDFKGLGIAGRMMIEQIKQYHTNDKSFINQIIIAAVMQMH
jgi:hypothetical protein